MSAHLGYPPHYFDSKEHGRQHHFPRAYLRNADYNHEMCTTLYNNSPVTIQDFPLYFGTSRSEMYREQAIELWRTGMPFAPVRTGAKSYAWHHLDEPAPPSKTELQKIIVKTRMQHPYTLLFLETIRENGGASQKEMSELLFHTFKKGSLDQVHPTYGDLDVKETKKGKGWGLIENEQLTDLGNRVLDAHHCGLTFVCGRTDFGNKRDSVRLLWSILREIESESGTEWSSYPFPLSFAPHRLSIETILQRFQGPGKGTIPMATPLQIKLLLDELGIGYHLNSDVLILKENIYLSITPATYIGAGLYEMDGIANRLLDMSKHDATTTSHNQKELDGKVWVIGNDFDPVDYPSNAIHLTMSDWLQNCRIIDSMTPKAIIFAPEWSPAWMEFASGELHAYVAGGGNVIVHRHKSTRTGTSKMFFTGLIQDIDRFSHLPGTGWRFDTNLGPRIGKPIPIYSQIFFPSDPSNNPVEYFCMSYGVGDFHFFHKDPAPTLYSELTLKRPAPLTDSPHWKWRRIANLYRDPKINREPDTYPILGADVLRDHLKFKLSTTFAHHYLPGVPEQNWCDLVILYPAPILFEVDTLGGGKRSRFGSISGGSTAIDDMHVQRQVGWFVQAKQWIDSYLQIVDDSKTSARESQIAKIAYEIRQKSTTDRMEAFQMEFHMNHLSSVLETHRSPNAEHLEQSVNKALRRIGDRPGSLVIGTNYGWREGMKSSARETSIENGTSLWTFRDLYEFLVRTDDWDIERRQQAFINILAKDGGPVCWHVAEL
jgi:hypothetical protein